ncbi:MULTISPECIES: halo transducer protein [unclassified Halorubrum]|uniref:halo transducer protein n=1 Tax=unclassified Halorubrum TaxID=2642239 RepID=UPI000B99860B|nr:MULTISPECIES: halo transducer protein [unclassified Halorubrum]OYR41480.1 halo transducer protein [Halorubrum sp. Eb13]OYR52870.1 halo transducer protein [Halorubrum sp. Ea1]
MSEFAPPEVHLDELVDDVADRTGEDPESVRTWLDPFTDDGSVTPEAIEATVTDVSQILATAETRVDLATRTVEDASDAVADVPNLEIVGVRQNAFEERLADLRSDVEELGGELSAAANDLDSPVDIYEAAVNLHEVTTDAQRIVRVAHDLETEIEAFEAWLGSANRRRDALVDDVEAAEESVESLGETVESLRNVDDPGLERWFDAAVQARVLDVVVADLRAEAAGLREWAEREDKSFPDDVETRIESIRDEATASASALADHPDWDDRFDERLEDLDAALSAVEPPVAWGRVDEVIQEAREGIAADGPSGD